MNLLKKLPRWAVIVILLALIAIMASTFIQHLATNNRVNERKKDIQERQKSIQQEIDLPDVPDIWD